ncbi:MAG: O-antigen ligase family protein [Burkholderiales bacterium]
MPPSLALAICAIFVIGLLLIERRDPYTLSGAVWIPTLWMLWISSKPIATWFGVGDEEASTPDQIFGLCLLVAGMASILKSRSVSIATMLRSSVWLCLFLTYSLVSVFWADDSFVALKRWGREVLAVVMALVICNQQNPFQAMRRLLRRAVFVLIPVSLLLIKYYPTMGVQYRKLGGQMWIGAAMQKNSLGRLCAVALLFGFWSLYQGHRDHLASRGMAQVAADIVVLVLAAFLLAGPGDDQYSATALVSLATGILTIMGLEAMRRWRMRVPASMLMFVTAVIIAVGTIEPFLGGSTVATVSEDLGRNTTLTGRTEIWEGLIPDVMRQPFLGSGFASFWTPKTRDEHEIGEAHNGYLEVLLDRGSIGILLLAFTLIGFARKSYRALASDFAWGTLSFSLLVLTLVHNYTESSINSFASTLPAILLLFAFASDGQRLHAPAAGTHPPVSGFASSASPRSRGRHTPSTRA